MSEEKKIAPWPDFSGKQILEGDTIVHPNNEEGIVVYDEKNGDSDSDRWLVNYGHNVHSRLCLQIGDKGKAIVCNQSDVDAIVNSDVKFENPISTGINIRIGYSPCSK